MSLDIVDPRKSSFPHCIVWTPIPVLTWLLPFIGHVGIALADGTIHDFAGSRYVSVGNMAFGEPYRFIQCELTKVNGRSQFWDNCVLQASEKFRDRTHSLITNNCHSHVCEALNLMNYDGHSRWNMISLSMWMLFKGRYVNNSGVRKEWVSWSKPPFEIPKTIRHPAYATA